MQSDPIRDTAGSWIVASRACLDQHAHIQAEQHSLLATALSPSLGTHACILTYLAALNRAGCSLFACWSLDWPTQSGYSLQTVLQGAWEVSSPHWFHLKTFSPVPTRWHCSPVSPLEDSTKMPVSGCLLFLCHLTFKWFSDLWNVPYS